MHENMPKPLLIKDLKIKTKELFKGLKRSLIIDFYYKLKWHILDMLIEITITCVKI